MKRYSKVLQIPERLAEEIINRNIFAYKFITDENCLVLGSKEENLNLLLAITLHRKDYDREPLKKEEEKILEDTYNIIYRIRCNKYNCYKKEVIKLLKRRYPHKVEEEESIAEVGTEKIIAEEATSDCKINYKDTLSK